MNVARNAAEIIAARRKGMKPADMVCISFVGTLCNVNPVTHAKASQELDWRWVKDLDVCVFVGPAMDWIRALKSIAECHPSSLSLWFTENQMGATVYLVPTAEDICKPVAQWGYELQFTDWMDFQNEDFLSGRTYQRNAKGVPNAAYP